VNIRSGAPGLFPVRWPAEQAPRVLWVRWSPVIAWRLEWLQVVSVSQKTHGFAFSSPGSIGFSSSTGSASGSTICAWTSWYSRAPPDEVGSRRAATTTRFRSCDPGHCVAGQLGSSPQVT
jgi:hypothetical protein